MPQLLYKMQPVRPGMLSHGPTTQEEKVIGDHFAYLQNLVAGGVVLMAGRTLTADEHTFGIVVLRADSQERTGAIVKDDPAVKCDVMRADLFPYRVSLWSNAGPAEDDDAG